MIKIIGFFIFFFFKDLKKISKKILFGSPATIKIGLFSFISIFFLILLK